MGILAYSASAPVAPRAWADGYNPILKDAILTTKAAMETCAAGIFLPNVNCAMATTSAADKLQHTVAWMEKNPPPSCMRETQVELMVGFTMIKDGIRSGGSNPFFGYNEANPISRGIDHLLKTMDTSIAADVCGLSATRSKKTNEANAEGAKWRTQE